MSINNERPRRLSVAKVPGRKPGRPRKELPAEYPVDNWTELAAFTWDTLPNCCQDCVWLYEDKETFMPDCKAMTELMPDCWAHCDNKLKAGKLLDEIARYSSKKSRINPDDSDREVISELNQLQKWLDSGESKYAGWMSGYYADMHRGKRGGGGEQEKAPNKARPKKPLHNGLSWVEKWRGFDE